MYLYILNFWNEYDYDSGGEQWVIAKDDDEALRLILEDTIEKDYEYSEYAKKVYPDIIRRIRECIKESDKFELKENKYLSKVIKTIIL